MDAASRQPVLILGGGINGTAIARELMLNGVPVWLVDTHDIAGGATARSSRLIHGGLRYLEYGDFALVRESLAERARLRRLAPQFVEPLRLHIPVQRRGGGLIRSALRFLGASRSGSFGRLVSGEAIANSRGLWLVRLGLWLYDRFAGEGGFDKADVLPASAPGVPEVNADLYRWQCVYTDAQMLYPERFVVAMLEDARQLAAEQGIEFRVLTYHRADWRDGLVEVRSVHDGQENLDSQQVLAMQPSAVINATGAWGDLTLDELKLPSKRLFGGTKGSHFLTHQPQLRAALGSGGVYAEADDGRLVFVLPFGASVLVGTTDERFDDRPDRAVASPNELSYLVDLVNDLFPQVRLTLDDVDMHYAGVRPLPYQADGEAGAIPRGHRIVWNEQGPVPVLTIIGGKLTTCRKLAEQVVAIVAERIPLHPVVTSRERVVPGGENYPVDRDTLADEQQRLAIEFGFTLVQIQAVWSLCGTRTEAALQAAADGSIEILTGSDLPLAYVRYVIEHEWVQTLGDLVERRLMLLYRPDLSVDCLRTLAGCLVEAGRLDGSDVDDSVTECIERLREVYGKQIGLAAPLAPVV
jgi:glycerol-3-phosphate dehydrogenase